MAEKILVDFAVLWADELLTLGPHNGNFPRAGKEMQSLGVIKRGAVASKGGRIVFVGESRDFMERVITGKIELLPDAAVIQARGKTVMPGFVDCHTHLIFDGSREEEFAHKIRGASYLDILKKGGGILSTVRQTREADDGKLFWPALRRLEAALSHGTCTIEIKSGYGLSKDSELRILRLVQILRKRSAIDIVPTFLGAHAFPLGVKREDYVAEVSATAEEVASLGLAEYCDVFCEEGAFSAEEARVILRKARDCGLKIKLHAGEFHDLGGVELGAQLGAASIDHLDHISKKGMRLMAEKRIVGVLLPGVSFHLMSRRYAPARKLIDAGVPLALATDFNPGSCPTFSMQMIITLACRQLKITPEEAIVASTINSAHAIGRAEEVGSLEVGKKADIIILDIPTYRQLPYWFGFNLVKTVNKNGRVVDEKSVPL
ncbi:MAG: imidazolonepropionase [Candidatus Wildermuthbacteria bacterium RIFCSPLOWO2_02_FULL_47_10]|nr:MAG: imidazolonepropionase [Candidatus Wildermuthbacteria bacterium RIFCSPLOWO2_02_FULL_47_10]